jgi:hypothetical protein
MWEITGAMRRPKLVGYIGGSKKFTSSGGTIKPDKCLGGKWQKNIKTLVLSMVVHACNVSYL